MIHELETTEPFKTKSISLDGKHLKLRSYFLCVTAPNVYNNFFVYVERHEQIEFNQSNDVVRADLKLKYCVLKNLNHFDKTNLKFSHFDGSFSYRLSRPIASITGGAVFMDPESCRGIRLGSFFMNQVIKWVKEFEDAEVDQIVLSVNQSRAENKLRRNRFYEQFGIQFNYENTDNLSGSSKSIMSHNLKETDNWKKNIKILSHVDVVKENIENASMLSTADRRNKDLQKELDQYVQSPLIYGFKWFFMKLFYKVFR